MPASRQTVIRDLAPRLALLFSSLALCALMASCAPGAGAPKPGTIERVGKSFDERLSPRVVAESDGPWLGGTLVTRRADPLDTPLMRRRVTLRQRGSLRELAASVSRAAGVPVLVSEADTESAAAPLDDMLVLPPSPGTLDVNYAGSLRGLLDTLAGLSGQGWDYESGTGNVVFSAMQVKTFTLSALAGSVSWESKVTNRSRDTRQNQVSGTSINAAVTSGDSSSQTAQENTSRVEVDVWKDVEAEVRALLSRAGTVSVNQAAGTVTVRDTFERLRQISRCIAGINARLERQVALRVRVWALEAADESEAALGLQAIFASPDVRVVAGSASLDADSLATVSVLKGKLSGSSGVLRAFKEWGRATQLTSASGLVLNNQPFPVQAVRRRAYLAGVAMSTSEYSQTSEITPGEVTTGFAMTIIPHILPDGHVLLQYSVTLSSLEDMTAIERDTVYVQLPQVATRAFSQRTRLKAGQTLMLAGFEQDSGSASGNLGLMAGGRGVSSGRTLLLITIELEEADNV